MQIAEIKIWELKDGIEKNYPRHFEWSSRVSLSTKYTDDWFVVGLNHVDGTVEEISILLKQIVEINVTQVPDDCKPPK